MDAINQAFQEFLDHKDFKMIMTEQEDQWIYQGKFQYSDVHYVDFAVSITKSNTKSLGQIVFNKIGYQRNVKEHVDWLSYINKLNDEKAVYYYFVLGDDNYIYMRYVTELTTDVSTFFNILIQGPSLIGNLLPEIEDKFGSFVVL